MIKYIVFFSVLSLMGKNSAAQNNNEFVEVTIEDTIQLQPEEIIFTVYYNDYVKPGSTNNIQRPLPGERLRILLSTLKIDTVSTTEYGIQNYVPAKKTMQNLQLKFYAPAALKKFIQQAQNINTVTGYITNMKSSKEEIYKQLLLKKLLKKAEAEALFIALESQKTVGNLMQLKEDNLAAVNSNSATNNIVIRQKIIVRYYW